ncbi:MAG: phosphatidylcholine/phosphatidylserine synthase [Alphaproteobacteria bacterium]|nr:phosphatidylcholine/phosphatidylserine synthase [Alphaproteobacteria bacterium]
MTMLRRSDRRLRALSFNNLLPNALTVLALCAAMTAIRFTLLQRWELAVMALVVAGVLDGLDGRLARLLNATTRFGAELDSLSDFIAFGIAPGLMMYLWAGQQLGDLGWITALAYVTCCALRLARFNVSQDDPSRPHWSRLFFIGLSTPSAAGLVILPLMVSFQWGESPWRSPELVALLQLLAAFLMVSRIRTYSLKRVRIRRKHLLPALTVVALMAAMLVSYPWVLLPAIAVAYVASIPFSLWAYYRLSRAPAVAEPPVALSRDDAAE